MANILDAGKGEAWASVLQEVLRESFVGSKISTTKFEGLFDGNDTVHFPRLAKITTSTLASSYDAPTIQDLVETDETFVLDTREAAAYKISNEDLKELRVSPESQAIKDMAEAFANSYDVKIFSEYANAAYTVDNTTLGGAAGGAVLTKANIYEFIVLTGKVLDEANVPMSDRFIVFSPAEKALLLQSPELIRSTEMGDKIVTGGKIGMINEFTLYWSNNLQTDGSSIKHALAGAGKPICFAANIKPKVEITPSVYRDDFVSLVKAQTKFGVKTFTEGANRLVDMQIAA